MYKTLPRLVQVIEGSLVLHSAPAVSARILPDTFGEAVPSHRRSPARGGCSRNGPTRYAIEKVVFTRKAASSVAAKGALGHWWAQSIHRWFPGVKPDLS